MTYEEWWASYIKATSIYTLKETTEDAWEAGVQEGLRRNCEWVGLTEEEAMSILLDQGLELVAALACAIEAKIKEKNV